MVILDVRNRAVGREVSHFHAARSRSCERLQHIGRQRLSRQLKVMDGLVESRSGDRERDGVSGRYRLAIGDGDKTGINRVAILRRDRNREGLRTTIGTIGTDRVVGEFKRTRRVVTLYQQIDYVDIRTGDRDSLRPTYVTLRILNDSGLANDHLALTRNRYI